jgi:hypothetical protein
VGVSPLQLVNLHRNQRYFVIKLHTWFCLIFLEDKHKILLHITIFYVNLRVEVAAVLRNRYGVEKTVDTHTILINAIKFYVCLINDQQYSRIKQMNKYNIDFFYMHLFTMRCRCFKSVIQSGRSLFLSRC